MIMDEKFNSQKMAIIAYITVCLVWGSTYLAIKFAVLDLPPMLSAGIRFVCAGLIMFGFSRWKNRPLPHKEQIFHQALVGLFVLLGGNGLVVIGSQWLHSSVAALLFATVPLFIAILELLLPGGEKLIWPGWLGLIIGFIGVALLVLTGQKNLDISLIGAVTVLIGAIFWASGSVFSKRIKSGGAIEVNLSIQSLAAGLGFLFTGLLLGEANSVTISRSGVLAILYLIFFGSLLGYNAYIYLLSVWPAAKVGTYAYINPFIAIFLGHLILDEPLTIFVFIGTAVILTGVFLVQFSKTEKKEPEQLTM